MDNVQFDDLVKCPWCTNQHDIVKKRLEIHFSKLKQNRDPCVKNLKSCRYNIHHKFLKKDESKHYAECADAKEWGVREALHQKTAAANQNAVAERFSGDFYKECEEESWDTECEKLKMFAPGAFKVPDNYHAVYEEKQFTVPYSAPKEKVIEDSDGFNTWDSLEDQGASDDKRVIRKLEKKLKEIKKLEEKAEREEMKASLTTEEREKISKKKDFEKQLKELKEKLNE